MPERAHDIVLYGATGFVGQLIARHFVEHAPPDVRIALGGRSRTRLEAVRSELGPVAADWPLIVADSSDSAAVTEMVASTRVLATTVGPYLRYGKPIAKACAQAGTDYIDLTGEVLFVRWCADELDAIAKSTGARIVNSCGFDSIPSDLGVLLVADQARADGAGELTETTLVVRSMRGGISGGTIDSLRAQLELSAGDRGVRRLMADPYALSPQRDADPEARGERDDYKVHNDTDLGWVGPFVMASYNTRIVRRSNALSGYAYGHDFRYREVMGFGRKRAAPVTAAAMTGGLGLFAAAMSRAPLRKVLDRLLPKPGEGPSDKTQRTGRFKMEVRATTTSGRRYSSIVAAQGDPGYAATAVMFGESALALAVDRPELSEVAGVLTPAVALGAVLIERLRSAGLTLTVRTLN